MTDSLARPDAGAADVLLALALPLVAAFLLPALGRLSEPLARALAPGVVLMSLLLLAGVWPAVGGAPLIIAPDGVAASIGPTLFIDRLALVFALLVPALLLLFWTRGEDVFDPPRRDAAMLLLAAAGIGVALAGDLLYLVLCAELAGLAMFGLFALRPLGRASIALLRYLPLSAFGTMMTLIGVAIIQARTGTLHLAAIAASAPPVPHGTPALVAFALLLAGFGIKAQLFPFNTWVPEVYATAPARVAALATALIAPLALLVLARLARLFEADTLAADSLLLLGLLTLASGALGAWRARALPSLLAFSTSTHLGLSCMALALGTPSGVGAGLALLLHHALIHSVLFGLATRWTGALTALHGASRGAPLTSLGVTLLTLSLIGVPPLPGFWAKLALVLGLAESGGALRMLALAGVLLASLIEAAVLLRLIAHLYTNDRATDVGATSNQAAAPERGPPPPTRADALLVTAAALLLMALTVTIPSVAAWLEHLDGQWFPAPPARTVPGPFGGAAAGG